MSVSFSSQCQKGSVNDSGPGQLRCVPLWSSKLQRWLWMALRFRRFAVKQRSAVKTLVRLLFGRFVCGSVDSYAVLVDDFFDYRQGLTTQHCMHCLLVHKRE